MSDETEEKKLGFLSRIVGKDVSTIPCFRNTFLISISAGLTTGFAYFMYSSKTRKSANVGYGSFFLVTISYWAYCRYKWSAAKFQLEQLKQIQNYRPVYADIEQDNTNEVKQLTETK